MPLLLTAKHDAVTKDNVALAKGDKVEYLGHLPGGNVLITAPNGKTDIAMANWFKELTN